MKNVILAIVFLVIGGVIGFFAGTQYLQKSPYVDLTLVNKSPKQINSVTLIHEHGYQTLTDLPASESRHIKFYTTGETSYLIQVMFADGKKITSSGRYAKDGYKIKETITEKNIQSDTHIHKA